MVITTIGAVVVVALRITPVPETVVLAAAVVVALTLAVLGEPEEAAL
jgi:hypothetical protein